MPTAVGDHVAWAGGEIDMELSKGLKFLRLIEQIKVVQKRSALFMPEMEENMEEQYEGKTGRRRRLNGDKSTWQRYYEEEESVYLDWYSRRCFRILKALYLIPQGD